MIEVTIDATGHAILYASCPSCGTGASDEDQASIRVQVGDVMIPDMGDPPVKLWDGGTVEFQCPRCKTVWEAGIT